MKPTTTVTRRRFLRGISTSGLLLAAPRAMARENAIAPLRELANGKPLIGTAVATNFCALTELDVDVIPRSWYWNPKTREEARTINPYADGCPPEILEQQANTYREAMGAVMANIKRVDRVSFWGFTDARSWLNTWPWKRVNHGLLFDRNSKPKPAFYAVAEMLTKR